MAITVRQLGEEDAAAYRELRLRLLQDSPDSYGSTYENESARPVEHTAARLRALQSGDEGFTLGAFADDGTTLVGMATLRRGDGPKLQHRATIFAMGVAPEMRGRRIGRALLDALLARARTMPGLEQIYLTVVIPNDAARQLYRSCGFVTYGIDERGLKLGNQYWDEVQMIRFL
jgi:RimJ/RimL family protein N-acetyltransferase